MKKLAKVLSLTLALVMCAVILTACGVSIDSVKKKYEDDGYTVEIKTKSDETEWAITAEKDLTTEFVVCFKDSKDADKAEEDAKELGAQVKRDGKVVTIIFTITLDSMKKKYEDAGYTVEVATKETLAEISKEYGEAEWSFLATKGVNVANVTCFKDIKDAEATEADFKNGPFISVERDRRIVIFGTNNDALEAK